MPPNTPFATDTTKVVPAVQPVGWGSGLTPGESGSSAPTSPATLPYAATLTVEGSADRKYRCTLIGDTAIGVPASPSDGVKITFWLTASGGARQVGLAAEIKIPSSSSLTFPVSIASGKKARVVLEYDASLNNGQWEVLSFVNGY